MAKAKNGLFQARVWDGTDNSDGTKRRVSIYSNKFSRDLELKVRDLQNKVEAGEVVVDRNVDFLSYCQKWRDVYKGIREKNTLCEGVTAPRYKVDEKRCLTPEEKEAIKTADFSPMEKAFVFILYGCGLRRGEALALTIFDIDFTVFFGCRRKSRQTFERVA